MIGTLLDKLENIKTKDELSEFVSALQKDFKDNKDDWENQDLPSYLEAMSAWIDDMDGYYANQDKDLPIDLTWKVFADILFAARIYE